MKVEKKMSDLKHVMFDGISELEPEQLVEVANDAATIHQMVMDEFAAREARTAAAKAAYEHVVIHIMDGYCINNVR